MSLTLYFHPLSSFCQKVLIALYENDTPFEPHIVDLGDDASRGVSEGLADREVPGAARRREE
jgi:glutathione S-transferase